MSKRSLVGTYTAPKSVLDSAVVEEVAGPPAKQNYQAQRYNRQLDVHNTLTYKERLSDTKDATAQQDQQAKRLKTEAETQEVLPSGANQLEVKKVALPVARGIPLTDSVLDQLIPRGYIVATAPDGNKNTAESLLYVPPPSVSATADLNDVLPDIEGIPMRKEDARHFSVLLNYKLDELESEDDRRNYQAQILVFKIKNGPPNIRKKAMRVLSSTAADLTAKNLFEIIIPLMQEPALDDADRHILTKAIGRIIRTLQVSVKQYTHQIISTVAPMLIDESHTVRFEAKETISLVASAVGLANVISSLRPDLDHLDEFVRNLTARVFAVVASHLGLAKVIPFIKAVIRSKKSWHARHTGIRIVHHLCVSFGGALGTQILPHLKQLVAVLSPGLDDDLIQVRTATANTLAQLADTVSPYGIEAFEPILEALWRGLKNHRGRSLAAFLRAIGSMIPLMSHNSQYVEYSNYYTRELMLVMSREFSSPDEDMRKSVLRILMNMPLTKVVFPNYEKQILAPFFQSFWNRRTALDSGQITRLLVEATALVAGKLDIPVFLVKLTPFTKNANENLRRMACEAIHKILVTFPEAIVELDTEFDSRLVDGLLYAFQGQTQVHQVYLLAFESASKSLGMRLEPHLNTILSSILYRLKSSSSDVRQQSADLISVIADIIKLCSKGDDSLIRKLILFLYEQLGEVYPEVLGSIIGALYSCVATLDKESLMTLGNPSVNILLPTLTPILKNRQEKVQEQCIKLVGLIARRNAESINSKEWMRVCFDLLDMLKSQRKRIRVAANATFGDIAKTIGPQDVLAMLLNNLTVQDRQLRVCTAVAIGIVAEACSPFTILPALMNEYRVPDKNVQNGVLKSLSFLFEYLDGSTTKDYLFAITTLLEDALTDRDQVHRQTAATVVRHLALNCYGISHDDYQDIFVHLLNLVLPNIFETSPHVITRIIESLDALRIVLGPGIFLNYIWAGLFQAARKVRAPYWKVFNLAYVQNCDSIVPFYPSCNGIPNSKSGESDSISYNIDELDVWM